jgi:hypothetical protein
MGFISEGQNKPLIIMQLEMVILVKSSPSIWVALGDKYESSLLTASCLYYIPEMVAFR